MSAAPDPGASATALTVALGRECAASLPEVKYALRALLRIAGYGARFVWQREGGPADITYGGAAAGMGMLHIPAAGHDFRRAGEQDATGSRHWNALPFLLFPGEPWQEPSAGPPARWPCDIVFATYWFLTGAREGTWKRDRWDNLHAHQWIPVRDGLLPEAPVSRWGSAIRAHFVARGYRALSHSWQRGAARAAFSFTHDVDYPQIIRWIEVPRLLMRRRRRGVRPALDVARGASHFWTFREWIELERRFGARPTFYFMARRGSLRQYAMGRPDDFYDVRAPEFTRLFGELRDAGCEIGLHASYRAYQSAETLRVEAERVAHASGGPVLGNRHHFWHLDPDDPNETLRRHELAGLRYDSSLGLEFFPGFRRGTCHPFHPFHPGERRELGVVQVPPAWMDDHFDRRMAENGITDPDATARRLLQTARDTGGVAVVDYHSRGMNAEFYPRYGPWLARLVETELDASLPCRTPGEIATEYQEAMRRLDLVSSDQAVGEAGAGAAPPIRLEIEAVTEPLTREVADLHYELFGNPDFNGHSVATLGPAFLAQAFYRLNLDNPDLHALVARADGRVVGFFVYAVRRSGVFAHLLRRHPLGLARAGLQALLTRPSTMPAFLANLRFLGGESLDFLREVPGWCVVIGVHPDARSPRFEQRAGVRVAVAMFDEAERRLQEAGCSAWYVAVRPDNAAVQGLLRRRGAEEAGMARAQGLEMRYYVKRFGEAPAVAPSSHAG